MIYRKLERVYSNGYTNYIPNFDKVFPELNHISSTEMCQRFKTLGVEFYKEIKTPVPVYKRLTMPFALITLLLMIIILPLHFLITGNWTYDLDKNNYIINWFKSLKLL